MSSPELSEFEEINRDLIVGVAEHPDWWEWRKSLAIEMYNAGLFEQAAELIWSAPEIPPVDTELAFSVRILAKSRGRRAIRLCGEIVKCTKGNPHKLKQLALAFLEQGLVMEAVRFYGAATVLDDGVVDPQLEFWILWVDEYQRLWEGWKAAPKYEELPWLKARESEQFKEMLTAITPGRLGVGGLQSEDGPAAEGVQPPMPPVAALGETLLATHLAESGSRLSGGVQVAVGDKRAEVETEVDGTQSAPLHGSDAVKMAKAITQRVMTVPRDGRMVPASPLATTGQVPVIASMPAQASGAVVPGRMGVPAADTTVQPEPMSESDRSTTKAMERTRRIMMPQDLPKKTKPVHLAEVEKAMLHEQPKAQLPRPAVLPPKPMKMQAPAAGEEPGDT